MTKQEQNQIIKDAWTRNLQKGTDIPENIGTIYRNWVQTKIQQVSAQLQQPAQNEEQDAENTDGGK